MLSSLVWLVSEYFRRVYRMWSRLFFVLASTLIGYEVPESRREETERSKQSARSGADIATLVMCFVLVFIIIERVKRLLLGRLRSNEIGAPKNPVDKSE